MKKNDIVKYAKPDEGEEGFRFVVREVNGDRGMFEQICDATIMPVECLPLSEMEVVEEDHIRVEYVKNGCLGWFWEVWFCTHDNESVAVRSKLAGGECKTLEGCQTEAEQAVWDSGHVNVEVEHARVIYFDVK